MTLPETPEPVLPVSAVDALIRRLDAVDDKPEAIALRKRSYDLLLPASGPSGTVVDVGCGAGRAVAELAERGTRAVGIDLSEQMITTARRRHPEADVRLGNALALPFGDGELVGYRADKVLHDLPSPEQAIDETRRVLASGGRAVLIGPDWDALVIDSDRPGLIRRIVQARADLMPSPRAARAQRRLLLDAGFLDVSVEAHTTVFTGEAALSLLSGTVEACRTANAITDTEADTWLAEQHERARADRLFAAIPIFLSAATRP
jgi:ubiquinone/menaquinone biosynthesis C-methylase UbiE